MEESEDHSLILGSDFSYCKYPKFWCRQIRIQPSHVKPHEANRKTPIHFSGFFSQRLAVCPVAIFISFLYSLSLGRMGSSCFSLQATWLLNCCVNTENLTKARKLKCFIVQNRSNSDLHSCFTTVADAALIHMLSNLCTAPDHLPHLSSVTLARLYISEYE